ncbi:MAG: DMT family transporter [Nocardioidaceae bacterium]
MTHDERTAAQPAGRSPMVTGLALAVLSASSFGMAGALGKGLLETGWTPGAAVLARVTIAAATLAVPAALSLRGRWHLLRRNLAMILVFGMLAVVGTQFFYFQAIARMQVGLALLIEYTAPVAVVAFLWLRYGHRPSRLTLAGGAIAALGLVFVLDLLGGVTVSVAGTLWALAAMVGAATYFVLGAREAEGLPPIALAAVGLLVGAVTLALLGAVGLLPLRFSADPVSLAGTTAPWWLAALGLGVVTAAVSYASGVAASRRLGSRLASFVALLEVVAAVLFAWLLLGELPRPVQLVGGLLILAGVVVVKLGETGAPAEPARRAR